MSARARMLTNVATACEVVALGLAAAGVTGLVGLACDLRASTLRD